MPAKKSAKKKKGKPGDAPDPLKIKMSVHKVGKDGAEPLAFEVPPTFSLCKAKHLIDQHAAADLGMPRGSLVFANWTFMLMHPNFKKTSRQVRRVDPKLIYDASWLSKIGIGPDSFISLRPAPHDPNNRDLQVVWYINVPEIPAYREPLTPQQKAKKAFEKYKADKLNAGKKKKKKK